MNHIAQQDTRARYDRAFWESLHAQRIAEVAAEWNIPISIITCAEDETDLTPTDRALLDAARAAHLPPQRAARLIVLRHANYRDAETTRGLVL